MKQFEQAAKRAEQIFNVSHDKEKAARYVSAEFNLVSYVSRGKVWASGLDEQGKQRSQVIFN